MCNTKEAQSFLKQLKKLDCMITNKLIEREQWKAIATGITPRMGEERVQSSGSQQKMSDAVNRYIDIEKEIDLYIDKLIDAKKDVIAVIERLNAEEYDLIHKVYVQYITYDELAEIYDKSKSWCATIHGKALVSVQRILDERKAKKHGKTNV
jgi:hypothetical protein